MNAQAHITAVAASTGIPRAELVGPSKRWRLIKPRRLLIARLVCEPKGRNESGEPVFRSLPEVGRHVGGRDHSTIYYNARKFGEADLGTHPKATLSEIRAAWAASLKEIAA